MTDAVDATGNLDDISLTNAPFQNGGVYSNGIYYGVDLSGSVIQTPSVANFDFGNFSVMLDFYIEELPDFRTPIIICGLSWRWMGAYIEGDKLVLMANDGSVYELSSTVVSLDQWHNLIINYNSSEQKARIYLDDNLVLTKDIDALNHNNDASFVNEHAGSGETFKGYWKDLKVFNASHIASVNDIDAGQIKIINTPGRLIVNIGDDDVYKLNVYGLGGNIVANYSLGSGSNTLDNSKLSTGVYLLEFVSSKNQRLVKKLMIK
ncbi:MAG: T9SS type A sorting domain-containing protein [Chlorobi bacterium]|nr:T9SS type A sorting domain-containing protein [Chlorobiota bacterium]